jgi:hypothetical protein
MLAHANLNSFKNSFLISFFPLAFGAIDFLLRKFYCPHFFSFFFSKETNIFIFFYICGLGFV